MESIEKLRKVVGSGADGSMRYSTVMMCLDEIEREIAERYMELPLDADGVPIRPGDRLEYDYGDTSGTRTVVAIIYDGSRRADIDGGAWDFQFDDDEYGEDTRVVNSMRDFYSCNRHVKPRTVDDVLREFGRAYHSLMVESMSDVAHDMPAPSEIIAEYAAEIRELMEVDA